MPYFPYSRQSKKKSHRGSITARMIANMLDIAGVDHVITIDLHANQMQGFFHCPVDNLVAEPLLAQWVRANMPGWQRAVVVSKNPGGTKRVTSLADVLKLNFGIVMTDRRRPRSGRTSMNASMIFDRDAAHVYPESGLDGVPELVESEELEETETQQWIGGDGIAHAMNMNGIRSKAFPRKLEIPTAEHEQIQTEEDDRSLSRVQTAPSVLVNDSSDDEYGTMDSVSCLLPLDPPRTRLTRQQRSRDVVTGRLYHGHIIDDDAPSPTLSTVSTATLHHLSRHTTDDDANPDAMTASLHSLLSARAHRTAEHALGGSADAVASSDDEEEQLNNPTLESTVTLVGNVKHRPVIILDDMIDKATTWIAAAETVRKRGGATRVYCMATHGLFGGRSLEELEACDCIDKVVVTNAFPIPPHKARLSSKLVVLEVAGLLAEAIRRNHHGESMSQLYTHYD